MKFKSKIEWWLHLIFIGFLLANIWAIAGVLTGNTESILIAIVFTPLNIFLMLPIWLNTYYLFEDGQLRVKCGFFNYGQIDCKRIISVTPTKNPISAPAPSMDRLEICFYYKNGSFKDSVIISPADKEGFFEQLRRENPDVEISEEVIPMSMAMKVLLGVTAVIVALSLVSVAVSL